MKKWGKYYHLCRNIPNNFLTRWLVKKANNKMVKDESLFRLERRYRKPVDGYTYSYFGNITPKDNQSQPLPGNKRGKVFSLYLRNR